MFSNSDIFSRSSPQTTYSPPSHHSYHSSFDSRNSDASSIPRGPSFPWPDAGYPYPSQSPRSHPVKDEEEEESLPVAMHFEQDSAESYHSFDQLLEEDSDLVLKAAQAKRKVCQAQKHLADCVLEHDQILTCISRRRAEAANMRLLLADLNVGRVHSERRRKNGITMLTTIQT
ncbi:hypothetical protein DEU56DRAFT_910741 [Suillus clintonianus]|uniref:uncharacterized protein n=1 Tax=Suillus clintonianus TaxID=1904413 RepID=UPI001B87DE7F|nr:uncharacterized protein DEU56DRAFT_910741 [Suillus clintonianus]KAG2143610.1 hypothetical protein DEU56DRAFT_910741 [Suillus clintonianus]